MTAPRVSVSVSVCIGAQRRDVLMTASASAPGVEVVVVYDGSVDATPDRRAR